ncbi:MAG: aspartate aminotransferase family protein [Dehalococcoidia bacterium]
MAIDLTPEERVKAVEVNTWFGEHIKKAKKWSVYTSGHGIYIQDSEGKEFIDAHSGQFCASLGHGNKEVIKAIQEQLDVIQYPEAVRSDAALRACQRVGELAPGDLNRVYLGLSGSDANEAAVSVARSFYKTQGKDNSMIIARWHSYHGQSRTAAGLTHAGKRLHGSDLATANHGVHHVFAPYCYRCDYGLEYPSCDIRCARAVEDVIRFMGPGNVAAVMGEPILGAGGNIEPPDEYWPLMREICDRHGILLILDEVVTGWGKTGKLFACEHWGVVPDIMVCGKGMSSAYLPVSAVIVREHVYTALNATWPYYGHTHSFYPAGAAAVVATLDIIMRDKLYENAGTIGAYMKERLEAIAKKSKIVGKVHGKGLLLGMEIVEDKATKVPWARAANTIRKGCADKGVLIHANGLGGSILSIVPPMIITRDEADKICDVLEEVIQTAPRRTPRR